jgi:PAS domain S-box-containing protein
MINSDLKQLVDKIDYIFYVKEKSANNAVIWANQFTLGLVGVGDGGIAELNEKLKLKDKASFAWAFLFENDIAITEAVSRLYYLETPDVIKRQRTFFLTKIPDTANNALICFGNEITDSLTSINRVDFFRLLLNSTNDALVLTEVDYPFRILYANQGFLKLTGYKRLEEVLGKSPTELVGKSEKDAETRKQFNENLQRNKSASAVFENYKRGDRQFPYKNSIRVIPLYEGGQDHALQYFLGIQEDVTAQQTLKASNLFEQNKLRAIFNTTESFLWLLDAKGQIVELNKTAKLQSRGLADENLLKRNFVDGRWWQVNDEVKQKVDDALTDVIRRRRDAHLQLELLMANDDVIIVSAFFRAIREVETGNLQFIVVEAHDVTELENQKRRAVDLVKTNKNTNLTASQIDNYVHGDVEGTREDLIRLTKTETVLNSQVIPQLNQLTEVVLDPKEGLAIMAVSNARALSSIKDDMADLNQMKEFANLGLSMLGWMKRPFFKWVVLILLGSMGLNSIKAINEFVNYRLDPNSNLPIRSVDP